jgi:hypothetical protein
MGGLTEGAYRITWHANGRQREAVFNTRGGVDRWLARHPDLEATVSGPERSTS